MEFVKGILAVMAMLVVVEWFRYKLLPSLLAKRFRKELSNELRQCLERNQAELLGVIEIYFEQVQKQQAKYEVEVDDSFKHTLQELLVAIQTLKAAPDYMEIELSRNLELVLTKAVAQLAQQQQMALGILEEIKEHKLTT